MKLKPITYEGKIWVFDRATDTKLIFKPSSMMQNGMGLYLKRWRKKQDLSQTEIAEMFGCTQSFIAKVEAGERPLPPEIFDRIRKDNVASYGR